MKTRRIHRVSLLAAGIIAFAAAATLLAQVPRQRPAGQRNAAAGRPALPAAQDAFVPPGRHANDGKDGPGDDSEIVALFAMKPLKVHVEGRVVTIAAKSLFHDRKAGDPRPGTSYVWGLKIVPKGEGAVAVHRIYDHQAFRLQTTERHYLTFDEGLELPPGEYTAEVRVYSVRHARDVERLKADDAKVRDQTKIAESRASFSVPG